MFRKIDQNIEQPFLFHPMLYIRDQVDVHDQYSDSCPLRQPMILWSISKCLQYLILVQKVDYQRSLQLCLHWNSCMNKFAQGCMCKYIQRQFLSENAESKLKFLFGVIKNSQVVLDEHICIKSVMPLLIEKHMPLHFCGKYQLLQKKKLLLSLHTAGTMTRGKLPRFPVQCLHQNSKQSYRELLML